MDAEEHLRRITSNYAKAVIRASTLQKTNSRISNERSKLERTLRDMTKDRDHWKRIAEEKTAMLDSLGVTV